MVEFPWEHHMTYTGKSKHTIKLSGLFLVKPNTRKSIWPPLKSQIVSPYHPWGMLSYSPACISSNKPFWKRSIPNEWECCNGSIFCLSKVKVSSVDNKSPVHETVVAINMPQTLRPLRWISSSWNDNCPSDARIMQIHSGNTCPTLRRWSLKPRDLRTLRTIKHPQDSHALQ